MHHSCLFHYNYVTFIFQEDTVNLSASGLFCCDEAFGLVTGKISTSSQTFDIQSTDVTNYRLWGLNEG